MYKTKKEVDTFVENLSKLHSSEAERRIRFFSVARAYASVREFALAKRFLKTYIECMVSNTTSATSSGLVEAYKLMGDILMDLNEKESALDYYKKSYDLNPNRVTLNRVCDLLHNGFGDRETLESKKHWFTLQKTAASAATNGVSSPSFGRSSGTGKSPIHLHHNGGGEVSLYQLNTQQRPTEITPQNRRPSNSAFEVQFMSHFDKKLDDLTANMKEQMGTLGEQMGKLLDQNLSLIQTMSSTDAEIKGLKDQLKSLESTVNSSTSLLTKQLLSSAVLKAEVGQGKEILDRNSMKPETCKDLKVRVDKMAGEMKSLINVNEGVTTPPKAEPLSEASICWPINKSNLGFEADSIKPAVTQVQATTTPQFSFGIKNATGSLGLVDVGNQSEKGKGFSFGTPTLGSSIFSALVTPTFGQKPTNSSVTPSTTESAVRALNFDQAPHYEKYDESSSETPSTIGSSKGIVDFVDPVTHFFGQTLKPVTTVVTLPTITSGITTQSFGCGDTSKQSTKSEGFFFGTASSGSGLSMLSAPATPSFWQKSSSVAAPTVTGTVSRTLTFGDLAGKSENVGEGYSFGMPSKGLSIFSTPLTPIYGQKSTATAVVTPTPTVPVASHGNDDREDEFVPTAEFVPVIPLPPLIAVKKGNENENTIFEVRAKLLRFHEDEQEKRKEWKERGIGNINILQDKENKTKVRIVMWRDQIHTLACNHWIDGDTSVTYFNEADKNLIWSAMDFAEGEARKEFFVCKFSKPEQCKEFKAHIDQLVAEIKNSPPVESSDRASLVENPKPSSGSAFAQKPTEPLKPLSELFKKPSGSWTCSTCYNTNAKDCLKCPSCETLKPVVETSMVEQATATPQFTFNFKPIAGSLGFGDLASQSEKAVGFSFGASKTNVFSTVVKPIFKQKLSNTTVSPNSVVPDHHADEDEEFVPTAEFAPVIPLPPLIEVNKGDENENTIFEVRAKLFRFCKDEVENRMEWKERGIGNINIFQDKKNKTKVRIVMWREQIYKLACNHRIEKDTKVTYFNDTDKKLMWSAMDFAEGEPRREIFACKFGKAEQCSAFKAHLDRLIAEIGSASTTSSNNVDEFLSETSESQHPTTASSVIQCLPEPLPPLAELFKKPEGSWACSGCYLNNAKDCSTCPSCETLKPGVENSSVQSAPAEFKPSIPQFSFGFKSVDGSVGFGDLANQCGKFGGFTFATSNSVSNLFSGPVAPLFGQKLTTNTTITTDSIAATPECDDHAEEEFVPTTEFAPVIPLPPLIDVKKGDENDNTIYEVRAKLFRFHEDEKEHKKEWKERGIGYIKILQDKENKTKVRIVMWREQIYKLACNHRVDKDTSINFYNETEKNLIWNAMDFAEGEPKKEIFVCKFGMAEHCRKFKSHIDGVVEEIKNSIPIKSDVPGLLPVNSEDSLATTQKFPEELKPLSELFKTPEGSWSCNGCYLRNTKDITKCPSCETLKPGVETSLKSEEPKPQVVPQFSFGFKATPTVSTPHETSCPGCIGCEPDNFDFTALNNREIPEYPEQTMSPKKYAEFLASTLAEEREKLAIVPFSSSSTDSISSPIVGLSSPFPGFGFGTSSSSSLFSGSPQKSVSFGTPTFKFGSPLISTPAMSSTQPFSVPPAVVQQDDDDEYEDVDEDDEDELEEPMFEATATVQIRYPDTPEYSDLGMGTISITYDNDLLCSRFAFLKDSDQVIVDHIICSDTHLQSIGDRAFAWSGLSEADERNFIKVELQATLETEDLYNSFLDRWTDSQDIASQGGVTEEYLVEDEQGGE